MSNGRGQPPTKVYPKRIPHDARRSAIVAAASRVFSMHGLEGATMRGIAKEAGFTTGSIYPYFDRKEAIYAAVLAESLERLEAVVSAKMATAQPGRERCVTGLRAFFSYYQERPEELSLGLYLYNGLNRSGLSPDLDASLNVRLRKSFDLIEDAFSSAKKLKVKHDVAGAIAQAVGLLVMERTGRLELFEESATDLFDDYLDALIA